MLLPARLLLLATAVSTLAVARLSLAQPAQRHDVAASFTEPAADARPMVRWWWFGVAVEKPEILRELQQMKADGIGGAELAFVYPEVVDDPAHNLKNLPFLSPEMLDAVSYAQGEGRKLGLRIDVTLCSGWPYGGPATTLAEAAGRLRTVEVAVAPGASSVATPALHEGETLLSAALVDGMPTPPPARRGAPAQAAVSKAASTWDPASAKPLSTTGGTSSVQPAEGPRVALFFIQSHTGQQVKRAAVAAEGYVLDPFSRDAVATHLRAVGEPLVKAFGATPPYAIFSDSLEAYGADWTPALPAEFRRRRGYDLMAHLPELVAGGTTTADRVRHDYGRTLTELVDENYLTQINGWAKAHGTKFRSQTYGDPAVSLSSQRLVDLPEGEGPQWRAFSTLRWATSANHLFGNRVTSGETFTWLHSPVFRATPLDMKAEADIDFLMGENQLIFHGWPYSPPQASASGEPGWSLYAAAVFNDQDPWHPVMPDITRYIARVSSFLRQGEPANQVAVLLPTDDAWAGFSPGHVSVSGAMQRLVTSALMSAILSAGYNVDFTDADAIDRLGIHHRVLVLPPTDRIPLPTLRKIDAFVQAGGKVISVGRAPSMDEEGRASPALSALSEKLFNASRGSAVADEAGLTDALPAAVAPDLRFTLLDGEASQRADIGFIRRKLPDTDIYFVANTSNRTDRISATFATRHRFGVELDPDTGESKAIAGSAVQLTLAPYESRMVVFCDRDPHASASPALAPKQLADLSADWQIRFVSTGKTTSMPLLTDWAADQNTRFYSGEAVYTKKLTLDRVPEEKTFLHVEGGHPLAMTRRPGTTPVLLSNGLPDPKVTGTGPGMRAWYEPPVAEAATVFVNGRRAGALWHPPYTLEVGPLLKQGDNTLEIHVYNTAINAWAALPRHDYKPLIEKYGDRFQMQDLDLVTPAPSGLLGHVFLRGGTPQ